MLDFIAKIDDQYNRLLKLYQAKEYEKAIEIIKVFNKYGKSDYKNLPEIKKQIRLFSLKKKLDFIPKIHINEYIKLSKDIDIEEDDSTEVFIRTPRYGQYFYTSDLPIVLEGVALSVTGDFSSTIVWTSNIDGELGKGKKIDARLSVGEHQIKAVGTNGVTKGSMTIRIYIEKDPDFLKNNIKKKRTKRHMETGVPVLPMLYHPDTSLMIAVELVYPCSFAFMSRWRVEICSSFG